MNQPPGSPPGPPPGWPPGGQQPWPQQGYAPPQQGYAPPQQGYASPQQGYPQQPGYPPAPYGQGGPPVALATPSWRWRYSPFIGIMYGPIPVGVIGVAIFGIIYLIVH